MKPHILASQVEGELYFYMSIYDVAISPELLLNVEMRYRLFEK